MNEIHKILLAKQEYEREYDKKMIEFLKSNPSTKNRIQIISRYLKHLRTRQKFDDDMYADAKMELNK